MPRRRRPPPRGGTAASRPVVMQGGVFIFPSGGGTTLFVIRHGGVKAPSELRVEPRSANGVGERQVAADEEQVTIAYHEAPAGPYLHLFCEWGIHLESHVEAGG